MFLTPWHMSDLFAPSPFQSDPREAMRASWNSPGGVRRVQGRSWQRLLAARVRGDGAAGSDGDPGAETPAGGGAAAVDAGAGAGAHSILHCLPGLGPSSPCPQFSQRSADNRKSTSCAGGMQSTRWNDSITISAYRAWHLRAHSSSAQICGRMERGTTSFYMLRSKRWTPNPRATLVGCAKGVFDPTTAHRGPVVPRTLLKRLCMSNAPTCAGSG